MAYSVDVEIPQGVNVELVGTKVKVSGPKGSLEREFNIKKSAIAKEGGKVTVKTDVERRANKAEVGTVAGHISNMIKGVKDGYTYKLKVYYAHFPVSVVQQGNMLLIKNFLGEKKPRICDIAGDTKVQIKGQDITLTGISKEAVGQTAANLENTTKVGRKDERVFQDGIFIVEKAGKAI